MLNHENETPAPVQGVDAKNQDTHHLSNLPESTKNATGLIDADGSASLTFEPDFDAARHFLNMLDPDATSFTFQIVHDKTGIAQQPIIGPFDKVAGRLQAYNRRGNAVYVTVNETDGTGRKTNNIVRARAVFQELDAMKAESVKGDPVKAEFYRTVIAALPLAPSIEVESSPGNRHNWLLSDELTLEDYDGIQRRMIADYASDPDAKDRSRVLRLPGFFHCKYEPFMVRIVSGDGRRYTRDEIIDALPLIAARPRDEAAPYTTAPPDYANDEWAIGRVVQYLKHEADAVEPGHRDAPITRTMHKCVDFGVTADLAAALMIEHWLPEKGGHATEEQILDFASRVPGHRQDTVGREHIRSIFEAVETETDLAGVLNTPKAKINIRDEDSIDPKGSIRARLMSAGAFIRAREPETTVVHDLMYSGRLYTMCGPTGGGKTAYLILLAFAIAFNRPDLIGRGVEPGFVLYLSNESEDDFRTRLLFAALEAGISIDELDSGRLVVMTGYATPGDMLKAAQLATSRAIAAGETFRFVIGDTLQSYFVGKNPSNPAEILEFIRSFRPITRLPGLPTVLLAAHPVKNATADNMVPYGAGSTLNEVDGNFTFIPSADRTTSQLHWQGKIRGPVFEPIVYTISVKTNPEVADANGRLLPLPHMRPGTDKDVDAAEDRVTQCKNAILALLAHGKQRNISVIAGAIHISRATTGRCLKELVSEKLVKKPVEYELTPAGRRATKTTANITIEAGGLIDLAPDAGAIFN
jgi:hypothetical protein